jgi:hypothetical protein
MDLGWASLIRTQLLMDLRQMQPWQNMALLALGQRIDRIQRDIITRQKYMRRHE